MHPIDLIILTIHHICRKVDPKALDPSGGQMTMADYDEFLKVHAVLSEAWTILKSREVKSYKEEIGHAYPY